MIDDGRLVDGNCWQLVLPGCCLALGCRLVQRAWRCSCQLSVCRRTRKGVWQTGVRTCTDDMYIIIIRSHPRWLGTNPATIHRPAHLQGHRTRTPTGESDRERETGESPTSETDSQSHLPDDPKPVSQSVKQVVHARWPRLRLRLRLRLSTSQSVSHHDLGNRRGA